jgi:hypothetical protein
MDGKALLYRRRGTLGLAWRRLPTGVVTWIARS